MNQPQGIFISHSTKDNDYALNLAVELEQRLGVNSIWVDFFNLDAGANLASNIPAAISKANWFILLASPASMESSWVKYEASLATFHSIEKINYKIITVFIEQCDFPPELSHLRNLVYVEAINNVKVASDQIVRSIKNDSDFPTNASINSSDPFVGRGREQDSIEIAAANHNVVYLAGIPGIGKTSLVKKIARNRFSRSVLEINLRLGHDLELLTRQIIAQVNIAANPQPPINSDDDMLLDSCMYLLAEEINKGNSLLLINNVENSTDSMGQLLPYLQKFINAYFDSKMSFPMFMTSTRYSTQLPREISHSIPVRIDGLEVRFMVLAIQQWYSLMNPSANELDRDRIYELAENLAGYPLAAKLVAGRLTYSSPDELLRNRSLSNFQQGIAEYILDSVVNELEELDRLILYAISIYGEKVSSSLLSRVKKIAAYNKDAFHESIDKLSKLLILNQNIDTFELHPFVAAYFLDESSEKGYFSEIAGDLATLVLHETKTLAEDLENFESSKRTLNNKIYASRSRTLLQVSVPTYRLLLATNRQKELGNIPYRLEGLIREMVFVAYDKLSEYRLCAEYALRWLQIDPSDSDVGLYLARAYARLEEYGNAERTLEKLDDSNPVMRSKIHRERGRILYQNDDLDGAIELYEYGRTHKRNGELHYAQINIDFARALHAKANKLWDDDPAAISYYKQASTLLKEARPKVPRFEDYSLELLADCLLKSDQISTDEAIEMLKNAFNRQPKKNGTIARRLAELYSDKNANDTALSYAKRAKELDAYGAILTLSKIYINQGKYRQAIQEILSFDPRLERDSVVANVLHARAKSNMGDYESAKRMLSNLETNQYVVAARIDNEIIASNVHLENGDYSQAKRHLSNGKRLLIEALNDFPKSYFGSHKKQLSMLEQKIS